MSTARRPAPRPRNAVPISGEYRMLAPRPARTVRKLPPPLPPEPEVPPREMRAVRPRRAGSEYLDERDGPVSAPVIEIEAFDEPAAPEAEAELEEPEPDSLTDMMYGTRLRAEAWPKPPVPFVPRPSPVPSLNAIRPPPGPLLPPPSRATPPPLRTSSALGPVQTGEVIAAFAGFGPPPSSILGAPSYAFHALGRRRVLSRGLAQARRHGSPDVALYEQALRQMDRGAMVRGFAALAIAAIAGAALVFTILRVLL